MLDVTGNVFLRKLGKPDDVDEDGKHRYMIIGTIQMDQQLPTDCVYPMMGTSSPGALEINVLTDRGLDIKERCVGMRADQILTSF